MSTRYKGSILSSTEASSSNTAAYGIWKQSEVAQLINIAWPNKDPYWTSVSMLLHGDGTNGAQNNTFIDSSSNNFSITRNGDATQGAYSPFTATAPYIASANGGSSYFDGTGDYLSAASNSAFNFGSNNFTVEFWIQTSQTTSLATLINREWGSSPFTGGWTIQLNGASSTAMTIFWANFSTSNAFMVASTTSYRDNAWHHVAWVRNGSSFVLYLDGVSVATATNSTAFSANANQLTIANDQTFGTGARAYNGLISNVRIVNGTAVYTAAFTPPTAPLTAITNTALLLNNTNAGIFDNAMQSNFVTVGTSQISTSVFKYGTGSMAFSGSGAWLTAIDKTSLQLGTGDFTIEGWVHVNAIGTAYAIVSKGAASTGWSVNITSGNKLQFSYTAANLTGATSLAANAWYYFAVVRSGSGAGNLVIYLNGTADATSGGAVTDNFNQTSILYVGASRTGTTPLNGYIDELRITKGVARYTTNFTAPQSAFPNQ
jgi:hypothetical protein